jgi:TPP-dependent pyruvate/acetoin dehydrogenase alpha subunit
MTDPPPVVRLEVCLLAEAAHAFRPRQDFPNCVPIGSQVCHAVGVAYAFKLRCEARVAVCIIGDGGTSISTRP